LDDFIALRERPRRARLDSFPATVTVTKTVHSLGGGAYVMTKRTRPNEAWGVGWAESDYWARRAWETPFSGDPTADPQPEYATPSAADLGLDGDLKYRAILESAGQAPGFGITSVSAQYRMTDGRFLFVTILGSRDAKYYFGSTSPQDSDRPEAIEFGLLTSKAPSDNYTPGQKAEVLGLFGSFGYAGELNVIDESEDETIFVVPKGSLAGPDASRLAASLQTLLRRKVWVEETTPAWERLAQPLT
jgi:hypothetical protein